MRRKNKNQVVYRDDELYLTLRGDWYHLVGSLDGRRLRKACGTTDMDRAKAFLENVKREHVHSWREDYDRADRDWKTVAKMTHDRQKSAARGRGIPFDLTPERVFALMKATGFKCAVSGIPFAKRFAGDGRRDPWAPSIDRIENRQGYTIENCRIVCMVANIAMSDWGYDTLLRLSRGMLRSSFLLAEEPPSGSHNENKKCGNSLISLDNSNI